jgi:ribosome-associated protein
VTKPAVKAKAPAKKAIAKKAPAKKSAAKKPAAKKFVKAPVKKVAAKKAVVKKTAVKKPATKKAVSKKPIATKAPVRKIVKAKIKAPVAKVVAKKVASRKPVAVAAPIKKPVAVKTQTKTAERKAKREAKAATAPAKKLKVAKPVAPSWPPLIMALLSQLDDAKAEEVIAMDLSEKSTIADTMVVASGRSGRHVNAIADQVVEALSKHGLKNIRIEGVPQCDWVLVDAGDVIVHVFRPEVRSFYNLEKLWAANVPE